MKILKQAEAQKVVELNLLSNLAIRLLTNGTLSNKNVSQSQVKTPLLVGMNGASKSATLQNIAEKYGWDYMKLPIGNMMKGDIRGVIYPVSTPLPEKLKPLSETDPDGYRTYFIKHWVIRSIYDTETVYCNMLVETGFNTSFGKITIADSNTLLLGDNVIYQSKEIYESKAIRDCFNHIPMECMLELIKNKVITPLLINFDELFCCTPQVMTDIFPCLSDNQLDDYKFPAYVLLAATTNPWPGAAGDNAEFIYDGVYDPSPATIDRCCVYTQRTTNVETADFLGSDDIIDLKLAASLNKLTDSGIINDYIKNIDNLINTATGQSGRSKAITLYYMSNTIRSIVQSMAKDLDLSPVNSTNIEVNDTESLLYEASMSTKTYIEFYRAYIDNVDFVTTNEIVTMNMNSNVPTRFRKNITGVMVRIITNAIEEIVSRTPADFLHINRIDLYEKVNGRQTGNLDLSKYPVETLTYLKNIVKCCEGTSSAFSIALTQIDVITQNPPIEMFIYAQLKIGYVSRDISRLERK